MVINSPIYEPRHCPCYKYLFRASDISVVGTFFNIFSYDEVLGRDPANGYRIYVDILTGKNYSQFWLLTWTPFIGQFVNPVVREGRGKEGGWGVTLF